MKKLLNLFPKVYRHSIDGDTIGAGSVILASDFIASSSGAGDASKAVKTDAVGQIGRTLINASFGGTGADGALTITSGATNIDLGGVKVFTKNYSSISITGTGSLTFTNPHANGTIIVLKCQGGVTLTSSATPMINLAGIGAAAGTDGYGFALAKTNFGITTTGSGAAGAGGALPSFNTTNVVTNALMGKYPFLVCGAGGAGGGTNTGGNGAGGSLINAGGSGGSGANTGSSGQGTGGRGGGCLVIECAGALNFTTANGISVAGAVGGNGTASGSSGGGGGGGAGCAIIIYNWLTSASGTITVSGGAGGTPFGSGGAGGTGGAGYSLVAQNTEFV